MKPEARSKTLLGITRSKAKMFEFGVPVEHHIESRRNPEGLFPLAISIVGDVAAEVSRVDGQSEARLVEAKQTLRFAAYFFDAFLQATQASVEKRHVTLLAAAAYYLCDLPGSAMVLARGGDQGAFDPECRGLDEALHWLLHGKFDGRLQVKDPCYAKAIIEATGALTRFYQAGEEEAAILDPFRELRRKSYRVGGPRELLLADLIFAVAKHRLGISARACLPRFTDLKLEAWEPALQKPTFMREFWPAQRLLGERGVFRGRSAVVQMPTSAGKTRATEVLIRSSFLSTRTKLAVVVAPFRALCHEIRDSLVVAFRAESIQVDEISDVPQNDFDLESPEEKPHVYVVTPEKLLYLFRQTPDLAQRIGLLIYDEGHQFDTGLRGVTYELLLTSLKAVVPADCQVVLISAVITNAAAINQWLNGEQGSLVAGADLLPNLRSVAFASWVDKLGRLEFMAQPDSADHTYFVPRVLETQELTRRPRERVPRHFPVRDNGQSIALYLGLKLVSQGAVAIFCGLKASVTSICEKLVEAYGRDLQLPKPLAVSDAEEVGKLARLIERHFGEEGAVPECAHLGVFTHHANTPTGVRLAVEHAMKESLIKMVVCTSTLAQGVNLPIRYLIVSGVYQGAKRISVRDFQNLIGRAGRSGMHTEGSVIFADPETYDQRLSRDGRWRWRQVAELLDPAKAEDCASSLLTLFDPLESDDGSERVNLRTEVFFGLYLENENAIEAFAGRLARDLPNHGFSVKGIMAQLQVKGRIIDALESFIMAASGEARAAVSETDAAELARGTLAYHLATAEQRTDLEALFKAIVRHVMAKVPDAETRQAYSRTLFGIRNAVAIHEWVSENAATLEASSDDETLLKAIWPILERSITHSLFQRCTKPDCLPGLAQRWIDEETPVAMLGYFTKAGVRFGEGQQPRYADIDHVIDLCENAFAFESVLVLTAIAEGLRLNGEEYDDLIDRINHLQKRLKYGAKSATAITLHELGFVDRLLAREMADVLLVETSSRKRLRRFLRLRHEEIEAVLEEFPSYYSFVWRRVLRRGKQKF